MLRQRATSRAKAIHWLILVLLGAIIGDVELAEGKAPLSREQCIADIEKDLHIIEEGEDLAERMKALRVLYWDLFNLRYLARRSSPGDDPNFKGYIDKLFSLFEKENKEMKLGLSILLIRLGEQRPTAYVASTLSEGKCTGMSPESIVEMESFLVNSQSLTDPCERVRYELVLLLQDVWDRQDVQQAFRQVIQQDKSVWVRSAALGKFWNLGFRNAYIKELLNESDLQRQIQLIDDLMNVSKFMRSAGTEAAPLRFYPLQVVEINKLRQLKETTTNESLQAKLKALLLNEADKTLLFYTDPSPGELNKPLILRSYLINVISPHLYPLPQGERGG